MLYSQYCNSLRAGLSSHTQYNSSLAYRHRSGQSEVAYFVKNIGSELLLKDVITIILFNSSKLTDSGLDCCHITHYIQALLTTSAVKDTGLDICLNSEAVSFVKIFCGIFSDLVKIIL